MIRITTVAGLILLFGCPALAQDAATDTRPGIAPDIREDETRLKIQRGDFVVVPIPISNSTLNEGLVVAGAYFYPQTEEEKKLQPASVTAAAGLYTSNDSRAFALVQQSYWKEGGWRFTGAIGGIDLRLSLLTSDQSASGPNVDWRINGAFLFAKIARRIKGEWYGGVLTRLIDANQTIETATPTPNFNTGSDARSTGLGAYAEYDSRDNPSNSSSGKYFKFDALFNDEAIPSYGAGLRFTVLKTKKINLRLDYARSTDSDAIHVSVGEAF